MQVDAQNYLLSYCYIINLSIHSKSLEKNERCTSIHPLTEQESLSIFQQEDGSIEEESDDDDDSNCCASITYFDKWGSSRIAEIDCSRPTIYNFLFRSSLILQLFLNSWLCNLMCLFYFGNI